MMYACVRRAKLTSCRSEQGRTAPYDGSAAPPMSPIRALLLAVFLATPVFAAGAPNVVLISIDTLRADHLPMYGYGKATAPFLSSMAEGGIVFEKAWVPMPSTTPSHGSMLTGQYPSGHGSLALTVPLNPDVETIAEALQKNGYHTIGAVAVAHIGSVSHFDQGFVAFTGPGEARTRDGKAVNADVFRMVSAYRRAHASKPLFLFAHYFDCHAPYGWWRGQSEDPATSLPERMARYDDSIRHVDGLIAELYRYLGSNGLLENTIFIVTSDHGEQIEDRGLPSGHADIYVETIRVPLIVFGAGLPATRVDEPVTNLDITPSIAAAAGVRLRTKVAGHNILPPRGDTLAKLLFQMRGLPSSAATPDFLVIGNPWYTRSIGLLSGSHYFITNFDYVYRTERHAALQDVSAADRGRLRELVSLGEAGGQRRYAIPATSYGVFTVTVDVVPEGSGCEGKLNVSMPPGVQYFSTTIERAPRTRVQFSAARLDSLRLAVDAASCKARFYYRLDRPADAPGVQGTEVNTRLFVRLLAERKHQASNELYDLETDPGMTRNLIADPAVSRVRQQLERKTKELYERIYGAAFDPRRATPLLPPEEIEKLKSLGYLF